MKLIENLRWLENKTGRCANCKKKFPKPTAEWGYDYKGKETCSYSCMRALERKDKNSYLHLKEEEEKARKRREQEQEQAEPVYTRLYIRTDVHKRKRLNEREKQEIVRLHVEGKQLKEIAQATGRSIDAISNALNEANVRKPLQRSKWITDAQKEDMKRYHEEGRSTDWIAKRVGCSPVTARRYIYGWRQGKAKE